MEQQNWRPNDENEETQIDWKKIISEYIIYWPFILGVFLLTLMGTYVYLRFQQPVYNISSSVLIKQGDKHKNPNIPGIGAFQNLGMVSMASNFDNEVIVIQSKKLVKDVVNQLGLYINYRESHLLSYTTDLYAASPVKVWMTPKEADKLPSALKLNMKCKPEGKVSVQALYTDINKTEVEINKDFDKLPAVFATPVGIVSLSLPEDTALWVKEKARDINVTVIPPRVMAKICKSRLSGDAASKTTSIINLFYRDVNPQRGVDFIKNLVDAYNNDTNEDKNTVASKTAEFINERILLINEELGSTENELASYKQKVGLTNLEADAQLMLQSNSQYEKVLIENANQIRLIEFLKEYIHDPANQFEVIPVNVGLKDIGLTDIISKYNDLLMEKKTLLKTSNENNPANQKLNIAIEIAREGINTTVNSVEKGLHLTKKNLNAIAQKYEKKIVNAPQTEKELISIKRQQEIKANLYLMLLQKREENAITLATTANNGKIIEYPEPTGPVAPKKMMFMLTAMIMGLAIPVALIWIMNLLKFKIEYRGDVEKITKAPIIGDIPQLASKIKGSIIVKEDSNGLEEEVFRSIRTNIKSILKKDEKVILFTSTIPGEGKSFTAGNLAASFAFMGKKTLIVGLDVRKPGLNKVFALSHKERGITQYLSNPEDTDLMSLCQQSDISKNLFILPGGTIPLNPTELVSDEALDKAFEILRNEFDYILVDTAPIGLVTDTQIIGRVADISVYICRAEYTTKNSYENINKVIEDKKLPRVCTLINGVNMNKRRNGYYYGYGKYGHYGKYGYGCGSGHGYGYGYDDVNKK